MRRRNTPRSGQESTAPSSLMLARKMSAWSKFVTFARKSTCRPTWAWGGHRDKATGEASALLRKAIGVAKPIRGCCRDGGGCAQLDDRVA